MPEATCNIAKCFVKQKASSDYIDKCIHSGLPSLKVMVNGWTNYKGSYNLTLKFHLLSFSNDCKPVLKNFAGKKQMYGREGRVPQVSKTHMTLEDNWQHAGHKFTKYIYSTHLPKLYTTLWPLKDKLNSQFESCWLLLDTKNTNNISSKNNVISTHFFVTVISKSNHFCTNKSKNNTPAHHYSKHREWRPRV